MKLTIAPLSTPLSITAAAQQAIIAADRLFIQTEQHPSAYWLKDSGIEYGSMDDLYESCYDFDELNAAIAQRLLEGDTDTVYALLAAELAARCLRQYAPALMKRAQSLAYLAQAATRRPPCAPRDSQRAACAY